MDSTDFYALRIGAVHQPDGNVATLTVHRLGILRVPSGRLGACDPFVNLDSPVVIPVPPGDYLVSVTIADVSTEQDGTHLREAYLSVVLAEGQSASVTAAESDKGAPGPDQYWVIPVDAGTVGFVDADAVAASMPADGKTWYEGVFDNETNQSWFSVMDANSPLPAGFANVVMPHAPGGENVILSHSGWGDGQYPLLATHAADGQTLAIHIDLGVVGPLDNSNNGAEQVLDTGPHPQQDVSAQPPSELQPAPPNGFFARLLGRK